MVLVILVLLSIINFATLIYCYNEYIYLFFMIGAIAFSVPLGISVQNLCLYQSGEKYTYQEHPVVFLISIVLNAAAWFAVNSLVWVSAINEHGTNGSFQ